MNKNEKLQNAKKNKKDEFYISSSSNMFSIDDYTIEQYLNDIDKYGLKEVWEVIISSIKDKDDVYGVVSVNNLGELYEIGLAHVNKIDKKEHGKYYTPDDVATVMSDWFADLKGVNVCDVCCGTGNLILAYLNLIGNRKACNLISSGKLYLYDQDELALYICKSIIGIIYGRDISKNIHCILGDFLDKNIKLPENCKVISNPPYFKIKQIQSTWEKTDVINESKEFYSAIMEKIIDGSKASVIITPYSFIGGDKFYSLRKKMNKHNGFIISFDNIPGNIFIGRKHGIFNSNSTNSVRAAITVVENKRGLHGFRCSGLIRFKNEERSRLLQKDTLIKYVGENYQTVNDTSKKYHKCLPELGNIYDKWILHSNPLSEFISNENDNTLCIPNTCRYFSVASIRDLNRTGKTFLSFKDETIEKIIYCFLNSSFCYWHWRLFDGGITYAISLLKTLPIISIDSISEKDKTRLIEIATEMQSKETDYLSYKKNAGKMQENIKFPDEYRTEINNIFLRSLNIDLSSKVFDVVHSNTAFRPDKEVSLND